jgi:putative acetyltransferase
VFAAVANERALPIRIEAYRPEWRAHFKRLNLAWISKHFAIEPMDERILEDPEAGIIAAGGCVLFALIGEQVIGTCALDAHGEGRFELIKMGVDEGFQGRGVGRALLLRALEVFRELGGRELSLETNSKLTPAITLYESVGFVKAPHPHGSSEYARTDLYMVLQT